MSKEDLQSAEKNTLSTSNPDKEKRILSACSKHDLSTLRECATTRGGLLNAHCRSTAWPVLLGCNQDTGHGNDDEHKSTEKHRDEEQVQLDVDRSFVYSSEDESATNREARNSGLFEIIVAVLRQHPMLNYFQGYHDIVQVLQLVLGRSTAVEATARLSLLRIRDYMLPTMAGTETHLDLLPRILYAVDPAICAHLSQTRPFFALASTLTLYAHDVDDYEDIVRLFDYMLASEACAPLYLFAAIVVSRRDELLALPSDEPDMLHFTLSKLPKPLHLEELIERTVIIFKEHPPESLPGRAWSRIPSSSVLKTTHDFARLHSQTLQDGEKFFEEEAARLRRREIMSQRYKQMSVFAQRYKRPAAWTGAAFLVAAFGIVIRSNQITTHALNHTAGKLPIWQTFLDTWQKLTTAIH